MIDIIEENNRRQALYNGGIYDPVTGEGSVGERVEIRNAWSDGKVMIPKSMNEELRSVAVNDRDSWVKLRCRHDFEFWAVTCARIKDKSTGRTIPFRLNKPQRRVLAVMEKQRMNRCPIRIIMLKARQWGGSLLYIYSYI